MVFERVIIRLWVWIGLGVCIVLSSVCIVFLHVFFARLFTSFCLKIRNACIHQRRAPLVLKKVWNELDCDVINSPSREKRALSLEVFLILVFSTLIFPSIVDRCIFLGSSPGSSLSYLLIVVVLSSGRLSCDCLVLWLSCLLVILLSSLVNVSI